METVKPKTTPKDFFLWLGVLITLITSASSLILLIHQYIDVWFPNQAVMYGDPYSGTIRTAFASIIVMFPLFIWFMRILHSDIRTNPEKKEIWVRRWLVFVIVFIAGLTMAIDIIATITTYLSGDLSTRFILKALTILLILGAIFWYFLEELRGMWERNHKLSLLIAWVVSVCVLVSICASFFIIGSPETARLRKLDMQKSSDLQMIQYQVINYWQTKGALPQTIKDMEDPLSGFSAPLDPQTGGSYTYRVTMAPYTFELCAQFNVDSQTGTPNAPTTQPLRLGDENWNHGKGEVCFERTIDPERFPLIKGK